MTKEQKKQFRDSQSASLNNIINDMSIDEVYSNRISLEKKYTKLMHELSFLGVEIKDFHHNKTYSPTKVIRMVSENKTLKGLVSLLEKNFRLEGEEYELYSKIIHSRMGYSDVSDLRILIMRILKKELESKGFDSSRENRNIYLICSNKSLFSSKIIGYANTYSIVSKDSQFHFKISDKFSKQMKTPPPTRRKIKILGAFFETKLARDNKINNKI